MSTMVSLFKKTIPSEISPTGDVFEAFIGQDPFTPEAEIDESSDYNCGAICNELEWARESSKYYVQALLPQAAEGGDLDTAIGYLMALKRIGTGVESDVVLQNRFRAILVAQAYPVRSTPWSIIESFSHLIAHGRLQIYEPFDRAYPYFQVRVSIEADTVHDGMAFANAPYDDTGYVNQDYVDGPGIGYLVGCADDILQRIKPAGVFAEMLIVSQHVVTKTCDVVIT